MTASRQPKPTPPYRKPVRGSLVWWLRFLGVIAFLVLLLLRLPRAQEVRLFSIDVRWLGFCMVLTMCQSLLEAIVWRWLLTMQRIRYPYPKTLLAYLASQYLGLVTPGHVGEFLAAGYVTMETGITFGYALSSVVMKKLLFWVTIFGFGVWGLPLLAEVPLLQGMQKVVWTSLVILVVLSVGIGLWVVSLRRLARRWEKLSPWQIEMAEFWAGMRHLCSFKLVMPLAVAAFTFSLLFFQLDAVLRSIGIGLPFLLLTKILALSRIAARLIPISMVGFGAKDAAVIVMLSRYGIDPAVGLTVTVLWLLCSYVVTLLLSGLCWWIKPLVVRRAAPANS